jgi:indolepyruvate ferredoxin oxidoreductase
VGDEPLLGLWVGFKCVADTVESSASVSIDPERVNIIVPTTFRLPPDGVSIRWPDPFLATEARMQDYKIYARCTTARANKLNRIVVDSPSRAWASSRRARATSTCARRSTTSASTSATCAELGIRVFKIAMPWPLEPEGVREFAEGLEEILVVEEKRQVVEYQLKEQLYNWRDDVRPRVVGKFDEKGEWVRRTATGCCPPPAS